MEALRCVKCDKKLGMELQGSVKIVCPRCHTFNVFRALPLTKELVGANNSVKT